MSYSLLTALENLKIHDHLCLIYETPKEQLDAVIPFIRIGLSKGERCFYIVDENTAAYVLTAMKAEGIDVVAAQQNGSLHLATSKDAYLAEGTFDPDRMIAFLAKACDEAQQAGFPALRVTGEMTWALGAAPGSEKLIEYESKLNEFFPQHNVLAICQYNRAKFPPEIIRDIIYTHPLVIYGGYVCPNFYYIPPDEFLLPPQPDVLVARLLNNLKNRQSLLVYTEERLRIIVEHLHAVLCRRESSYPWKIDFISDGIQALTGYPRDTFYRADRINFSTLVEPQDVPLITKCIDDAMQTGRPFSLEYRIRGRDGAIRWVYEQGGISLDTAGKTWIESVIVDITERRIAEEQRKKEQAEQIESQRREIELLSSMLSSPATRLTAQHYGMQPLKEAASEIFDNMVLRFVEVTRQSLERKTYKQSQSVSPLLRAMAEELGFLKATPRDVIDIFIAALQLLGASPSPKARHLFEEGRVLVLELMGHLAAYYRLHCYRAEPDMQP